MAHIQPENEQITHNEQTNINNNLDINIQIDEDVTTTPIKPLLILKTEDDDECCICLENLNNSSINNCENYKLVCGHHFHRNCLQKWLTEKQKCPLCNKKSSRLPNDQSLINDDDDDGANKSSDLSEQNNFLNEQSDVNNARHCRSTIRSLLPWTILCAVVVVIIIVMNKRI